MKLLSLFRGAVGNLKRSIPIFHLASMARSGETLMLRALNAHKYIHVVHNLLNNDSPEQDALFKYLMHYSGTSLHKKHNLICDLDLRNKLCLIIKQGVWEHRYKFNGIVLVRNPVSVFASLKNYDAEMTGFQGWGNNHERLTRWMNNIDPGMTADLERLHPLDQFCLFYNRRMHHLANLGLPVIHYENFVRDPERILRKVVSYFGLDFDQSMLQSHYAYRINTIGHGGTDLSVVINPASEEKYKSLLGMEEFKMVRKKTALICKELGYLMNWDNIELIDSRD